MAARGGVDVLLMLGDNHYGDSTAPAVQRRFYAEQRRPAGAEMQGNVFQRRAKVVLRRDVGNRVVHEHGIEGAPEPQRPHVALDVLAFGVQRLAQREHLRREIGQRARELRLEVRRVVAAARAQLEERPGLGQLVLDQAAVARGLAGVVCGRSQEVEPRCEVAVDPHAPEYGRRHPVTLRP